MIILMFKTIRFIVPKGGTGGGVARDQRRARGPARRASKARRMRTSKRRTTPTFAPSSSIGAGLSSVAARRGMTRLFVAEPRRVANMSRFARTNGGAGTTVNACPLNNFIFERRGFSKRTTIAGVVDDLRSFSRRQLNIGLFLTVSRRNKRELPLTSTGKCRTRRTPSRLKSTSTTNDDTKGVNSCVTAGNLGVGFKPATSVTCNSGTSGSACTFNDRSTAMNSYITTRMDDCGNTKVGSMTGDFPKGKGTAASSTAKVL